MIRPLSVFLILLLTVFLTYSTTICAQDLSEKDESALDDSSEDYSDISPFERCQFLKKVAFSGKNVECGEEYHHYNADAWKKYYNTKDVDASTGGRTKVKIASFNLLKLNGEQERLKRVDYLAAIMSRWDIISAVEIMPLIKKDIALNQKISYLLEYSKKRLSQLKRSLIPAQNRSLKKKKERLASEDDAAKIKKLKKEIKKIAAEIKELKVEKSELVENIDKAPSVYRLPGYIDLLKALQKKHGKHWALILSGAPTGSSATSQEYVGFYYRADRVRPVVNEYCSDIFEGKKVYACIPVFDAKWEMIFSRKPFVGSFESGNFDFTLLGAHVRFLADKDDEINEYIRRKIMPEDKIALADTNVLSRFAEVKGTLRFMDRLRDLYNEKDLIYLGDLNLENSRSIDQEAWKYVLKSFSGGEFFGNLKTTISKQHGLASSYDHMIFDPQESKECDGEKIGAFNFLQSATFPQIKKDYLLKGRSNAQQKSVIEARSKDYSKRLESYLTVKRRTEIQTLFSLPDIDLKLEEFQSDLFAVQSSNETINRLYQSLISDHLPIYLNCYSSGRDDD